MIVSDKYDENDDITICKASELTRKISTKIEPFLIGIQKFNFDNSPPLIHLIKTQGIEVA